jgi:hypothetical protein
MIITCDISLYILKEIFLRQQLQQVNGQIINSIIYW